MDFFERRKDGSGDSDEMSFIDHLEALRWHLIRSVIAVIIGAIIFFIFIYDITDKIIMGPTKPNFITVKWFCRLGEILHIDSLCFKFAEIKFQEVQMTSQFMATFTIAFLGGLIVAFPYVFWEVWKFVKPALSVKEKKSSRGIIFWVSLLFFIGCAFGYFILTPFMVNFYASYKLAGNIDIKPTFSDYLDNLVYTTMGIGLLFQMPLLILLLAKVGILTAKFLKKYRRHAFVVILIAAAIITPTTDPFSLAIVTVPLYLLFEVSIVLAQKTNKKQQEKQAAEEWS
jgi:sec-independent protein translocase protein TatC